jgi:hypothetical protein
MVYNVGIFGGLYSPKIQIYSQLELVVIASFGIDHGEPEWDLKVTP